MDIFNTFQVTASVNKYPKLDSSINYEGILSDKINKGELHLTLDKVMAANFLFKFTPSAFKYTEEYTVIFRYNNNSKNLLNIIFEKDDNIFIVTNTLQLLTQIHEGYIRLCLQSKVNSLLDFAFDIENEDYNKIEDEFEDKKENEEEEG